VASRFTNRLLYVGSSLGSLLDLRVSLDQGASQPQPRAIQSLVLMPTLTEGRPVAFPSSPFLQCHNNLPVGINILSPRFIAAVQMYQSNEKQESRVVASFDSKT